MHTLTLHDVPTGGQPVRYDFTFPGSWEEATTEDLITVCRVLAHPDDTEARRMRLLRELCAIPAHLAHRMPGVEQCTYRVDVTDRSGPFRPVEKFEWQLLPQLDWAFAPGCYTTSLLPEVEHDGVRWEGSKSGFDGMGLAQWIWATTFIGELRKAPPDSKDAVMNELLGIIYRPVQASGSPAPFDPEQRHAHAARLASLPMHQKLATVLNHEALHAMLPVLYRRSFDPEGEVQRSPAGLYGIAYDVAASGVFGDTDRTEQQPVAKVLDYMEHKLHQDTVAQARKPGNTPE